MNQEKVLKVLLGPIVSEKTTMASEAISMFLKSELIAIREKLERL